MLSRFKGKPNNICLCLNFIIVESSNKEDARILGLAMIPGQHVVSIEVDEQE